MPGIHPVTATVAGSPVAVVSTASGRWVFASVTSGGTGAVGVFAALWVTTEQSNALLAFATAGLVRDPGRALRAVVPVGSEPAGVVLADGGRIALVANSNRGLDPGTAGRPLRPSA